MYSSDRIILGAAASTPPVSTQSVEAPEPVPSLSHVNQASRQGRWLSLIPVHNRFVPPLHRSTFRSVNHG
jgi:hypothetical protein